MNQLDPSRLDECKVWVWVWVWLDASSFLEMEPWLDASNLEQMDLFRWAGASLGWVWLEVCCFFEVQPWLGFFYAGTTEACLEAGKIKSILKGCGKLKRAWRGSLRAGDWRFWQAGKGGSVRGLQPWEALCLGSGRLGRGWEGSARAFLWFELLSTVATLFRESQASWSRDLLAERA